MPLGVTQWCTLDFCRNLILFPSSQKDKDIKYPQNILEVKVQCRDQVLIATGTGLGMRQM